MAHRVLPIPPHFEPDKVAQVWRVPYQQRAIQAQNWARKHNIPPAAADGFKICLLAIDLQNTFCIPGFELFVTGRSGTGAVDDNRRLCEFIYTNLDAITKVVPTMDTHRLMAIFHAIHLVNDQGEHPPPFTLVSAEDVRQGRWRFNPRLCDALQIDEEYGRRQLLHYTQALEDVGRYTLTIWPYHAMLGGVGHALTSAVEEAFFFHGVARCSQPDFQIKGDNPFTEHYSVLGPEVTTGPDGKPIAAKDVDLIEKLLRFDAIVIAGQAKSHCVAWTIDDLLRDIQYRQGELANKVYLLEDCSSPVVVPNVIDYTEEADTAFQRFADAGMRVVRSTDPIDSWPGIEI